MFIDLEDKILINATCIDHIFPLHPSAKNSDKHYCISLYGANIIEISEKDFEKIIKRIEISWKSFLSLGNDNIINLSNINYIYHRTKNFLNNNKIICEVIYEILFRGGYKTDISPKEYEYIMSGQKYEI